MTKQEMMEIVKTTAKDSVAQVLDEVQGELVQAVKDALVPALKERKNQLVATLTKEIAETNNWGVKARDGLYILVLNIVEKIFENIENQISIK